MKNSDVLFSVIVPAYNSGSFISKCIESVLNQTCRDFELIIVDDGSKDDTLMLCRKYEEADGRLRVIHKENGGHTSARNEGLKNARGEYVLFLDSDDWFSEQTLEVCKEKISDEKPDIIIFRLMNSNAEKPFTVLLPDGYYGPLDIEKKIKNSLIMNKDGASAFPKSLSGKCFRREVLYASQMSVPEGVLVGEDGAAFVGAMLEAKGVSVAAESDRACYFCFVRDGSVSRSSDLQAYERMLVLLLHYKEMLKVAEGDYSQQFFRQSVAHLYTATLLVIRSGAKNEQLDTAFGEVMRFSELRDTLKKASFSLKGYKFIIKKYILLYRLWIIARLSDR